MSKSALPGIRHLLWLIVVLTACNLSTSVGITNQQPVTGAPEVQIASPPPNATFLEGVMVNIQARISNAGADINRVEIAVDDVIIASQAAPNENQAFSFSVTEGWVATGAGAHTITVTAFREDGTSNAPAAVTINLLSQGVQSEPAQPAENTRLQEEETSEPESVQAAPEPTDSPESPTDEPPPEPTEDQTPRATFTTGVNVRRGPGTVFEPPIGSFAANDSSEIVAVGVDRYNL